MIHYYFKFQRGNKGIQKWDKNGRSDIINLSIYFGKWKAMEIDSVVNNPKDYNLTNRDANMIKEFNSVKNNLAETYFWIFYKHEVLCFKPKTGKIYNGPRSENKCPKVMDAKLESSLEKHELPEIFANINSNQKYNRVTIKKLSEPENLIADSLINKKKISISRKNYLKFLSPIEFETLIFLIFNHGDSLCSSFRGGTLPDFDLKVSLSDSFNGLPEGKYWIQIKNKKVRYTPGKPGKGEILIRPGETDIKNRILGTDWLIDVINDRKDILKWLREMTFNYKTIFDFSW